MEPFAPDIIKEIHLRFNEDSNKVINVLKESIPKLLFLDSDRIIRCIIFLSKNSFEALQKNIKAAQTDYRDVIL